MTKEEYIERLNIYKAYYDYENKLGDLGINLWERDEICNLISNYLDLLAEAVGDTPDSYGYTWTSYFCYECEFGASADKYPVGVDNKAYYLHTPGDVWDLIHLVK